MSAVAATAVPRGIRNNNPGNIRRVAGVTWLGEAPEQTDDAFVQFIDPEHGIRAIARILMSYAREGLTTIQQAIDRWAPPNENNSAAYVAAVCAQCDAQPTDPFASQLPGIIVGIIWHENGQQPYTAAQIEQGVALA